MRGEKVQYEMKIGGQQARIAELMEGQAVLEASNKELSESYSKYQHEAQERIMQMQKEQQDMEEREKHKMQSTMDSHA